MKKLLTLTLIFSFTLLYAGNSWAAVHNFTNDDFISPYLMYEFSNLCFEGWYYVDKGQPSATARDRFTDSSTTLGEEYFQNDQTFANLTYYKSDFYDDPEIYLKGSYLFANNFFIGLDTGTDSHDSQVTFSPGYRFNLAGDAGYLAFSVDYAANDGYYLYKDSGVIDYEIDARYYTDRSRCYGQLVIPNEDVIAQDNSFLKIGGAYRYSDHITYGANIYRLQDYYTVYEAGCSASFDRLGAEFRLINVKYDNYHYVNSSAIDLNLLYSFTANLRAGLEYAKVDDYDDPAVYLKAKYAINDQNAVIYMQRLKNDTYDDAVTYLYWDIKRK